MGKRPDTWMPFYIGDYLRDTSRLTAEGHGAYLLLIFDYWVSGEPLPDDDAQLAAIARLAVNRWKALRPTLARFFRVSDGVWHHKRIDEELAHATENIGKRSAAGTAGATARWGNRNDKGNGSRNGKRIANASDTQCGRNADENAPSPSPSPIEVSDASASGGSAPPKPPVDPIKALWSGIVEILGDTPAARALGGKMRSRFGDIAVALALNDCRETEPTDVAGHFIKRCEVRAKTNGSSASHADALNKLADWARASD